MHKALVRWTFHHETCFLIQGRSSKELSEQLEELRASELAEGAKATLTQDGSIETTASTFRIVEVFRNHHI
jgi:hypothetical protein